MPAPKRKNGPAHDFLRTWMKEQRINQKELAKRLNCTAGHISKIVKYDMRPSLELIIEIEALTNGAVSVGDWIKRDAT